MITCVTWIPSNAAQEWPDKVHGIPIKNLPVQVNNFMPVEPEVMQQFLEDDDSDDIKTNNDDRNTPNDSDSNDEDEDIDVNKLESINSRKRKLDELENVESDNHKSKKQKTNSKNDDKDGNDGDNEEEEEEEDDDGIDSDIEEEEEIKDKIKGLIKEEEECVSEDDRFADISDPEEFTKAVLEGYDEEPLDFISRIGGLHSGIGIGPTNYTYNIDKKGSKWRSKRDRIISIENIYDTRNDSEIEDIHIKKTDEIFICLGCDEDRELSSMQVHVFDTELRTFYEHHDITLSALPLCCKWLSTPNIGRNLLAIGSIEESIEIFNLDVMDALQPICSLGGRLQTDEGFKLLKKWNEDIMFNYTEMNDNQKLVTLGELKKGSHSDSVLCLEWNKLNDSYLFSGSGDKSIKIWDLNKKQCINTMCYHSDKVQQIKLKTNDPNILLSGGFDKNVFLYDIKGSFERNKKNKNKELQKWRVSGEVETLTWHKMNDNLFMVTLDNGYIQCFDIRKNENKSIWNLKAHKKPITSLSFNNDKMDLFATCSMDKKIKLWQNKNTEIKPILLSEQSNNGMGGLLSIDFAPKRLISSLLIIGGRQNFGMFDIMSDQKVKQFYNNKDTEKNNDNNNDNNNNNNKHQHFIMEQTFNYTKDKKIIINKDEPIQHFLDDE